MTIIFFEQKYAALTLATKIFKNQEYHLFLPKGMQHTALVGKTIWLEAGGTRHVRRGMNQLMRFVGEPSRVQQTKVHRSRCTIERI